MSECKRQGVWAVPEHHSAFALMGSVVIDLRQAQEMSYRLAIVPGLLLKAVIGACDDALAALN